jgi:uncharacterized OB-fold protein
MQERMLSFKCKGCGRLHYPGHVRCLSCKGTDFEDVELGDECKLLTYTKLYVLPEGIEMTPLLLGIVEFPNGVRALGQLVGGDIKVGMRLRPIWGKIRKLGEKEIYGFRFEPVG